MLSLPVLLPQRAPPGTATRTEDGQEFFGDVFIDALRNLAADVVDEFQGLLRDAVNSAPACRVTAGESPARPATCSMANRDSVAALASEGGARPAGQSSRRLWSQVDGEDVLKSGTAGPLHNVERPVGSSLPS
jgi:hypothetical protein